MQRLKFTYCWNFHLFESDLSKDVPIPLIHCFGLSWNFPQNFCQLFLNMFLIYLQFPWQCDLRALEVPRLMWQAHAVLVAYIMKAILWLCGLASHQCGTRCWMLNWSTTCASWRLGVTKGHWEVPSSLSLLAAVSGPSCPQTHTWKWSRVY